MSDFLSGKKKIITMILGVISGLAIALGIDEGAVSIISGATVSVASVVVYILTEGKIDVTRIKSAVVRIFDAAELLTSEDEETEELEELTENAESEVSENGNSI